MPTSLFLDLAKQGLRMPIGTDLILHEAADPEGAKFDATLLGAVVERAAARYQTPLAFPLMDLTLEKADLLDFVGVSPAVTDQFHFEKAPDLHTVSAVVHAAERPFPPRIQANQGALRYIAEKTTLVPVGMAIGPFSLMTKLVSDPISPVAMAGSGATAEDDDSVCLVERCLALAEATVLRSIRAQIQAGARAIILCEPAANTVYLSPRQLRAGSGIFEQFVLAPNRRVRDLLRNYDVDLIFHDCGALTTEMVRLFGAELQPAMISLGGSRKLWEDAAVVSKQIVLYGNLPTKMFYSDSEMPVEEVRRLTAMTVLEMTACGHPHILGSECDVLHVPDAAATIREKVDVMVGLK
jgi:uroporphyrinogen-III decarboxylase